MNCMNARISTILLAGLMWVGFTGCASVKDTAQYYVSYTTQTFPPKAKDAPIPILGKKPKQPYQVIGRLAFESPYGWRFLRRSMEYNARANGADAVLLKDESSRTETTLQDIPPRIEYVPITTWVTACNDRNRNAQTYPVTTYVPIFRPAYTRVSQVNLIAIDAEMLVFKK